jgi:hypothetical protein
MRCGRLVHAAAAPEAHTRCRGYPEGSARSTAGCEYCRRRADLLAKLRAVLGEPLALMLQRLLQELQRKPTECNIATPLRHAARNTRTSTTRSGKARDAHCKHTTRHDEKQTHQSAPTRTHSHTSARGPGRPLVPIHLHGDLQQILRVPRRLVLVELADLVPQFVRQRLAHSQPIARRDRRAHHLLRPQARTHARCACIWQQLQACAQVHARTPSRRGGRSAAQWLALHRSAGPGRCRSGAGARRRV